MYNVICIMITMLRWPHCKSNSMILFKVTQLDRTQSTNVAASTIPKDSSTEGEKRAEQEKDGTGDKGKRKASEAMESH